MEKSVHTKEYLVFIELLRETRERAKITQVQLAKTLGKSQSFVSKCERGEDRLDIVQLREFCRVLGTTLPRFISKYEKLLSQKGL